MNETTNTMVEKSTTALASLFSITRVSTLLVTAALVTGPSCGVWAAQSAPSHAARNLSKTMRVYSGHGPRLHVSVAAVGGGLNAHADPHDVIELQGGDPPPFGTTQPTGPTSCSLPPS